MKYTITITTKLMRMMGVELYKEYSDYDRAAGIYQLAVSDLKANDYIDGTIISLVADDGRCLDSFEKIG